MINQMPTELQCLSLQMRKATSDLTEMVRITPLSFGALTGSNTPSGAHLAALGQKKLLELVVLDDEEIAAFANGEAVRGLTFTEADRYSVKELRAKLHDKEQELLAAEKLAAELHSQKDKLDRKLHHRTVAVTDWPAEFKGLVDQVQFAHKTIKHNIGSLDVLREKAMSIVAASPEEESALDRAKEILAEELLVAHRSCAAYLEALGLSYEKTLGAFAKEGLYQ